MHACLTAHAQSARGKLDRSGTPGSKSAISGGAEGWRPDEGGKDKGGKDKGGKDKGGKGKDDGTARLPAGWSPACWPLMPATRVADPVRLVRYPSASSCP